MANDMGCLKETFRIFRQRPVLYFFTALTPTVVMVFILFFAAMAIQLVTGAPPPPLDIWRSMGWAPRTGIILVYLFLFLVPPAIATSAVALLTREDSEGREPSADYVAAATFRRLLPLVVLGFVVYVGAFVGFGLLILPGLFFAAFAAFAIPAATLENLGPIQALKRSFRLTRGRIIKIMLIFLAAGISFFVVRVLLSLLLWLVSPGLEALYYLLFGLFAYFLVMLLSILLTILYLKARAEQEVSQPAA